MGSQAIQFSFPISHNYCLRFLHDNYSNSKARYRRCFSGGSRWEWEKNVNSDQRSRFRDAYVTDDYDEEVEFGFGNAAKQRRWWSDDFYAEDDDEDEGFGILEASIGFNWVFKIFQAFGWMIPAFIISMLLGTGPNSIIMALALPLFQSALSLAADTLWGRSHETLRPTPKSKKRPFHRAPPRTRVRKENEIRNQTGKGAGNYKSWVDANNVSAKKNRKAQKFGGWDELDNRADMETRVPPVEKVNERRAQEIVMISRRIKGDTPLFMRLLVAMFPFLGFWSKLF